MSPVSDKRFIMPLTDGGATMSIAAISLVVAKPPWLVRW